MDYEERFKQRLAIEKLDSDYEVVGKKYPLLNVKHKKCNNTFYVRGEIDFFIKGNRCFFCDVEEKTNGKFKVLKYEQKHNSQIYYIKCNTCGNIFQITKKQFYRVGITCRKCDKTKKRYTTGSFSEKLKTIYNGRYSLVGEYNSNKITLLDNETKNCFETNTYHFLEGRFLDERKYSTEDFKNEIYNYYGDSIKVCSEYTGYNSDILFYHKDCKGDGFFYRKAKDMLDSVRRNHSKTGCPFCKEISYGENILTKILKNQKIEFKKQFKFSNCKDKKPLPFDFAIFENKKLLYLLEFQGSQHYEYENHQTFYKNIADFEDRQKKDKIKKDYCLENNINLLYVSYKKISILENILKGKISLKFNDYPSVVKILQEG